jgi:hypothetical protein
MIVETAVQANNSSTDTNSSQISIPAETPRENPAQTGTQETTTETESDNDVASQFANIARRDRVLAKKERDLAERERLLNDKSAGFSKFEGLDQIKNPIELLDRLGYSIDDVLDHALNSDSPKEKSETELLRDKILELENQMKSSKDEMTQKELNAVIQSEKKQIENFVGSDGDKYELLNHHGQEGVEMVHYLMDFYEKQYGQKVDVSVAADFAEKELENKYSTIASLKKFRGSGSEPQPQTRQEPRVETSKQTLSNSMSNHVFEDHSGMTEDERVREAIKQIRFI